MKKIILLLLLAIKVTASQAQIKLGSYVVTIGDADTYATHLDSLGKGGLMVTYNRATRNSIPLDRRKVGMYVSYSSADSLFKLVGGVDNDKWVYKGSASTIAEIAGLQDSLNNRVKKSGDTMNGTLTINNSTFGILEVRQNSSNVAQLFPTQLSLSANARTSIFKDNGAIGSGLHNIIFPWRFGTDTVAYKEDIPNPVDTTSLSNRINLKANDNEVVKLAGDQTINGFKTFNSAITVNSNINLNGTTLQGSSSQIAFTRPGVFSGTVTGSTPTASNHLTTKSYVDTGLSAKANDAEVVKLSGFQTITGSKQFTNFTEFSNGVSGEDPTLWINYNNLQNTSNGAIYLKNLENDGRVRIIPKATDGRELFIPDSSGTIALKEYSVQKSAYAGGYNFGINELGYPVDAQFQFTADTANLNYSIGFNDYAPGEILAPKLEFMPGQIRSNAAVVPYLNSDNYVILSTGSAFLKRNTPSITLANTNGATATIQLSSNHTSGNSLSLWIPKRNGSITSDTLALKSDLVSGKYIPSWTSSGGTVDNVGRCFYTKIGNIVTVYGSARVINASGTNTYTLTLPINSNFDSISDLEGFAQRISNPSNEYLHISMYGDISNDVATISFTQTSATEIMFEDILKFHFTYEIK